MYQITTQNKYFIQFSPVQDLPLIGLNWAFIIKGVDCITIGLMLQYFTDSIQTMKWPEWSARGCRVCEPPAPRTPRSRPRICEAPTYSPGWSISSKSSLVDWKRANAVKPTVSIVVLLSSISCYISLLQAACDRRLLQREHNTSKDH